MLKMQSVLAVLLVLPAVFGQYEPNVWQGRSVYVHLFEWKWTDIAKECERFLGPKGFGGIQVSPPSEHRVIHESTVKYPWYQRYQPVSYKLNSRSGTEAQFIDMVKRCNNVGVRIYVDAVINHMAGSSGTGTSGSSFNAGTEQYPGVPFGPYDFTTRSDCPTASGDIYNYNNAVEVRNCRLLGMPDLGIHKQHTKSMLLGYLNRLVEIGVAGFRVDASKHMWPDHLRSLFQSVRNLNTTWFPGGGRPFFFHEVIDMGYGEPIKAEHYIDSGRVTEFKYGLELSKGVLKKDGQLLKYFKNFGTGWGLLSGPFAVAFIDNHDNQRGHGGGGEILTFRKSREYKIANAFMLAYPYGFPQIMSSYDWQQNIQGGNDKNDWIGPPSDQNGNTADIVINSDGTCGDRWKCEHRWRQITNMVAFRNVAGRGDMVHWWDNGANQVAWGRGAVGATTAFIVINNDGYGLSQSLQTGLPAGSYCDVISGNLENGNCSGKTVTVLADGKANFVISNHDADPLMAIHIGAKRP